MIEKDDLVRVLTILKDQWDARLEFLKDQGLDEDLAVQVTRESMTAWMNENVFSDRPIGKNQIAPSQGEERKGKA